MSLGVIVMCDYSPARKPNSPVAVKWMIDVVSECGRKDNKASEAKGGGGHVLLLASRREGGGPYRKSNVS